MGFNDVTGTCKLLREYNESLDKAEKPALDEQKYEEFYEIICGVKMPIFKSPISQY
ncbi:MULTISPECIES: YolD-like family protein [unclassified Bacillus (in: firmicutes)]|uniref:YolD-like family protein n=1 Tax=unclassified Bacillus (in: firmicutes) TaxID=185979 RepID=UPI002035454A